MRPPNLMASSPSYVEESRQRLPPCYALYQQEEGWFFIWKTPDPRFEDTWRDGPFRNKAEARRESWEDFEDRQMKGELDEAGRRVPQKS